jgi:hypothetical protein
MVLIDSWWGGEFVAEYGIRGGEGLTKTCGLAGGYGIGWRVEQSNVAGFGVRQSKSSSAG